jgi:hypothetical protein
MAESAPLQRNKCHENDTNRIICDEEVINRPNNYVGRQWDAQARKECSQQGRRLIGFNKRRSEAGI